MIAAECRVRGVAFTEIGAAEASQIYAEVQREDNNMDVVRLEKAPRVAVYVPPGFQPWDDAVTLALEYAEIKYDKLWDDEVLAGEACTSTTGCICIMRTSPGSTGSSTPRSPAPAGTSNSRPCWRRRRRSSASRKSPRKRRPSPARSRSSSRNGGFMFAMCSATDTYDIALAAENTDICDVMYDGDPPDPDAQNKLDFSKTLAFTNFTLETNPLRYEYSDIDIPPSDQLAAAEPGDRLLYAL